MTLIHSKPTLAISLLKALLYWQKAADVMLCMNDGALKTGRFVQWMRSSEVRAPLALNKVLTRLLQLIVQWK